MGAEASCEAAATAVAAAEALQRVRDEELRDRRVHIHRDTRSPGLELGQRARQRERRSRGLRSRGIGLELAIPTDRHLHDGGTDRSQDQSDQTDDGVATFAAAAPAPAALTGGGNIATAASTLAVKTRPGELRSSARSTKLIIFS